MNSVDYIVREYNPDRDASVVSSWWKERHGSTLPLELLPPVGVVVERNGQRVGALWLYLTIGHGVCFPEFPISMPGMSLAQSWKVFQVAMDAMEAIALTHDYKVMVCHTLPAIARVLQGRGFEFNESPMMAGMKILTNPEE